jgi:hypothetical protein
MIAVHVCLQPMTVSAQRLVIAWIIVIVVAIYVVKVELTLNVRSAPYVVHHALVCVLCSFFCFSLSLQ